ncbi:MAG: NAD(+)/NADH kinase [Treponema sp.]|jgi:NAD+ kinase|nr:NAD(+)/NADH kinase [Treponema sp.]
MAKQKKALLFINAKKGEARALAERIRSALESRSYGVDAYSFGSGTAETGIALEAGSYDIAFSLGGDGTVLSASRVMGPLNAPVLPVNLGSLGFIAAVLPEHWEETFTRWERGRALISRRLMLELTVERRGETVFRSNCLNEAVISASGIAKLIRLEVSAEIAPPETGTAKAVVPETAAPGGVPAASVMGERLSLGHFRADGLIVATPTGSTGYSVAAGGPIIDPEMDLVIINPICPFTLSSRPIVVPPDERIITLVEPEQRSAVLLTVDGQITSPLEAGDLVTIRRAPYTLRLIASDRWAFYRALRTKLAWSGGGSRTSWGGTYDA